MAGEEVMQEQQNHGGEESKEEVERKVGGVSPRGLSIWPPTQRTRDAVVKRMIESLSTPSTLSKRYGTLTLEEATAAARAIEEEAFAAVSATEQSSGAADDDDTGIEVLQIYSKEISKRMLEIVKSRAAPTSPSEAHTHTPIAAAASEDVSSVDNESPRS